ncbi:MAG TPA: hypothetical protein DCL41_00180 [Bdellovibrionales bacterium]|nr:hypothetical protein [Pseudobdellovibrionaceae bacterium]HAG90254.1 hypothetical protein [Bdellovibrionales bacterium]|tara:strand:- start:1032 stop:1337 length:306 start_codon:yes stop_codon:yes gene_type:complete
MMNWKFQNLILGWTLSTVLFTSQLYAESCKDNCPSPPANCENLLQKPRNFNLGAPRKLDRFLELQFQILTNPLSQTTLNFKAATFEAVLERIKEDGANFKI